MSSDCSNFEDEETAALMYAKLLRCTGYTRRAALTKGKPQDSGNPHQISQSAGQLFLVNARPFPEQSSSIATCRVGSISVAREGPGLRLDWNRWFTSLATTVDNNQNGGTQF